MRLIWYIPATFLALLGGIAAWETVELIVGGGGLSLMNLLIAVTFPALAWRCVAMARQRPGSPSRPF